MADLKISQLSSATLPLAGTEVLPIVQSGATTKVPTDDLTVRNIRSNASTGILQMTGPAAGSTRVMTVPNANFTAARTDAAQTFTGTQSFGTMDTTGLRTSTSNGTILTFAGYLGLVPANGNTKTLTITFDSALGTNSDAQMLVDTTLFGDYNNWDARGVKQIVSTFTIPAAKTTITNTGDVTGVSTATGIGGVGVFTRTGATSSTSAMTVVYTFNAASATGSYIAYRVSVVLNCVTAADSRKFTLSWS
jgi:hypothetical protein